MNDQLQQLANLRSQRNKLAGDLTAAQQELERQQKTHKATILHGLDARDFESEIPRLAARIQGLKGAIKSIDQQLEAQDETLAKQKRQERLEQIQKARLECHETMTDIYLLLAEAVEKLVQLRKKYDVYRNLSRGYVAPSSTFGDKTYRLLNAFRADLPGLLLRFPAELFKDGALSTPEEVSRSLRK
jgi:chromosome segregation ATPase